MSESNDHLTEEQLRLMIINSIDELRRKKDYLNKINVYPVRDGDTGDNLLRTLKPLKKIKNNFITRAVNELLINAKGNSGVIISQFYNGFLTKLSKKKITARDVVKALKSGYNKAYQSISKPIEGTIITVLRGALDGARSALRKTKSVTEVIMSAYNNSRKALISGASKLTELRVNGVVDAGGLGFIYMLKGWLRTLGVNVELGEEDSLEVKGESKAPTEQYCVNILLSDCEYEEELKDLLTQVSSEVKIARSKELLRIHAHTNNPSEIKELVSAFGRVIKEEIDDMRKQYEDNNR